MSRVRMLVTAVLLVALGAAACSAPASQPTEAVRRSRSLALASGPVELDGATLEWSVNEESNTGAFNGQCNYLSGGISDGSAATYRASDGNATVLKLTAAGTHEPISDFSTRCKDRFGVHVTPGGTARLGQKVRYTNGTGTLDPSTGEVEIRWRGTFTVNFYGSLTPFWFSDPELSVGPDGNGTITATMGGYASSIDDPDERELVDPVPGVVVATLVGVDSRNLDGFTTTPLYQGVQVDGLETPQLRAFPGWGAWPVPFVAFMESLGLGSYWYTTGGAADARKSPASLTVGFGTGTTPTTTTVPSQTTTTLPSVTTTTLPGATTTTTVPGVTTTAAPTVGGSSGLDVTAVVPGGPGPVVDDGIEEQEPGLPDDTFGWTISATGGITLGPIPTGAGELRFGGQLAPVRVIDTRTSRAAWSLSGQVSDFSGGLSGRYLGWTPRVTSPGAGAVAGDAVVSGLLAGSGLRVPSLLASAPAGHEPGSATLGADLELRIPDSTPGGTYTATLTITALG